MICSMFPALMCLWILLAQCEAFRASTPSKQAFKPMGGLFRSPNWAAQYATRSSERMKMMAFTPPAEAEVSLQQPPVFVFGKEQKPGDFRSMKSLLGGKGANLGEMSSMGLSVPPGFTVTTEVCAAFHKAQKKLPKGVWNEVMSGLASIERVMGRKFGDADKPLLVSVRSGAAISMPGMMDTVLNLGMNDDTVKGLSSEFGERFALDSYRRFLNMFGTVVMGIPHHAFEERLDQLKASVGAKEDNDLTVEHLTTLVQQYKAVYVDTIGKEFTADPLGQLSAAINAVFDSWQSERAIKYREAEGITGLLGTAVNVQAMVFGNLGQTSGTGVLFTRNPNTGEKKLYGEFLINAQGEDVVAGIRTPQPIAELEKQMPEAYADLQRNIDILEKQYGDMQDVEFTIQEGSLFMLQTRSGKRVGAAAMKIAVDMHDEGLASTDQAITMVKPEHLNQLLHPQFRSTATADYTSNVVATGLPASPGAAVGKVYFTAEAVEAAAAAGEKDLILARDDTSPEDVGGMWASQGMLTSRGGMTSHAAVVARGWGRPCVCGCDAIDIDFKTKTMRVNGYDGVINEGDYISLNGDTGEVIVGKMDMVPPSIDQSPYAVRLMEWVDAKRRLKVLANADTAADAAEARRNGAQGIGLTRTEHMFFSEERIRVVRRMILSKDEGSRQRALQELQPYQRSDFEGILEAMDGLPVTVRLLDPPLHEFLPAAEQVDQAFADDVGRTLEGTRNEIERMEEVNPMLGLRGCRLGIVLPQLVEMQARSLIEAALNNKARGLDPRPEIMIPLIGSAAEFSNQAKLIRDTMEKVFEERGARCDYRLGTMIEVPRAALTAAKISEAGAEFFSYGTNDLTQMTYGFSRDDCSSYLPFYMKNGIMEEDPFQQIDEEAVGYLIDSSAQVGRKMAQEKGKFFKAGICGEHGGDPKSVRFFNKIGMEYVSCSPFRVPVARLAAAQAVVEQNKK